MTVETKAAPTTGNGKAQTTSVWEELRRPFGAKEIEQREGPGGRMLDYVSHARVRDRLLQVDPTWTWEPMAKDANGQPVFERTAKGEPVGLWIRLMCNGISKPGYGDVPPKAFNPEKQLIGDAIRNAAMNFGVAIDLWMADDDEPDERPVQSAQSPWQPVGGARIPATNVPSSHPCTVPNCTGTLVQRTGSRGDFVSCTNYAQCGFKPADGRLEDYLEQEREMADAHDAPAEVVPTNEAPDESLPDIAYIKQAWPRVTSDVRLEAFTTGDLARALSYNTKHVWVLKQPGIEMLKAAPQDRVRVVKDYFVSWFQEHEAA